MPNQDNMNNGSQVENAEEIEQLSTPQQPVQETNKYAEFKLRRSAEEIGFMPPKKEKKKEMSKGEKTFFLVIISVLILAIAVGLFLILRRAEEKVEYTVNPKNVVISLKTSPSKNPTFYATFSGIKSENCVVDISKIDTSKEGTYDFVITCGQNKYNGRARVEGGKVIYKEEVTLYVGESVIPEKFIVKCKYKECESEFIVDEGVDINANVELETNIKLKTCEKGSTDQCVESDTIRFKKIPKIIESYVCTKQSTDSLNDSATSEKITVQFNNVEKIAGKIKYEYAYQTNYPKYYDDEEGKVRAIVAEKVISSDDVYYSGKKSKPYVIRYTVEEVIKETTKKEFIDTYINKKGYECTQNEIKTSE
jgi:hypothetical protein